MGANRKRSTSEDKSGSRTPGQIKRIWGAAIAAGIAHRSGHGTDAANLYLLIRSLTGCENMSDLSYNQAKIVIDSIQAKIAKTVRKRNRDAKVISLQTADQRKMIRAKLCELKSIGVRDPEKYAAGIVGGKDIYKLTLKQSQRLIDVLKEVLSRGRKSENQD